MKTAKKIWKGIAGKLKNRKGSQITTTSEGAAIEESRTMPEDVENDNLDVKEQTNVDKATETYTKLCEDVNEDSKDFQPIFESSEKAQNASTEQEPNTSNDLSSAEIKPCDTVEEKSSTQQKQAILAGSAGVVLLVGSVASYIMKMYTIAVVVAIIGLACVIFVLYNSFKPNTKLEKVEDVERPIIANPPLNPT